MTIRINPLENRHNTLLYHKFCYQNHTLVDMDPKINSNIENKFITKLALVGTPKDSIITKFQVHLM